jgi:hypothetical protein
MAIQWITPAGSLGIIIERISLEITLEALSDSSEVSYSLIAGSLPRGLRLEGNVIKGSPTEVRKFTESRFVIRAIDNEDLEDRTFTLSVDGSDEPLWLTREGFLNVGKGENYFVLDNEYVDFQLQAEDSDEIAGDILEYYVIPNAGELPPGLSLSKTGRISGFTDPIFAVDTISSGTFDTLGYDISYFDKPESRSNGYDSYLYDIETFDYNEPSQIPRRLSRFYSFVVGVTDGINEIRRLFKIWVVTEEFLKADNSIIQVDTNLFRADNTGDRIPIWITESNLGTYRANNYLTVYLDVYDPPTLSGTIVYLLLSENPDGSLSQLPPGMTLDTTTGEIAGKVPYQSRVSKTYTFTMQALDFPVSLSNLNYILMGDWSNSVTYGVNQAVRYGGLIYVCIQSNRNQLPNTIDSVYWESSIASAEKTFTIEIIGEIDSAIEWISESNLGSIRANQSSILSVEASSLLYGGRVVYSVESGELPPGLELLGTGDIIGKVKQFGDDISLGLTRFYERIDSTEDSSTLSRNFNLTWDGSETTFDKRFTFTVKARDTLNFAELSKEFYIDVVSDNTKTFANLYFKSFQNKEKRLNWYDFITNNEIFKQNEIYRYGDSNFGIQTEIKVLVYAGIESVEAVNYIQAISRNHYKKQLRFGDIKYASAKDPLTQESMYEVVYVEIVDELEKNKKSISEVVELSNNINSKVLVSYDAIKIDSDIPLVSDSDHQRIFPNSIKNMRKRIKSVGERDRSFLPLWMRSIQSSSFVESGYLPVLVLCYAKPGYAESIISRIKGFTEFASRGVWNQSIIYGVNDTVLYKGQYYTAILQNSNQVPSPESEYWRKNFNFKEINFTVDRYLIDTIDSQLEDKYLAFPQLGEKLP